MTISTSGFNIWLTRTLKNEGVSSDYLHILHVVETIALVLNLFKMFVGP